MGEFNAQGLQSQIKKIRWSKRSKVTIILFIIMVLVMIFYYQIVFQTAGNDDLTPMGMRQVVVASIKDLSLDSDPLPLLGEVQSQSSAILYAQVPGEVVGVYKKLGDFVYANQIIGEIDNRIQRSAVVQAQASVELAQANLNKVEKGGTDEQISILKTTLDNAQKTLAETQIFTVNTLNDIFVKVDDSVRNKIDIMFRDQRNDNPQVLFPVNSSQLEIDIEWERYLIEGILDNWVKDLEKLDKDDDLISKLDQANKNVVYVRDFLNNLSLAVNALVANANLSQTSINTWKVNISVARTTINAVLSSISLTKNNLNNAQAGFDIADLNYQQALTGGRTEDVAVAEAQLKQAQAGLQTAYANLEKTIIRAPLNGTINSLSLEKGNFVSAFTPVVTIANNKSLEIITYVTEDDKDDIALGADVVIDLGGKGVVKSIAPSLDSQTKKIKVEIEVVDNNTSLANGQSVSLLVERVSSADEKLTEFSIPISALKIGAKENIVFTVNKENKLVAHPVVVGSILGEKIIIEEGVDAGMKIVTDARGLQAGQEVLVFNQ